MNPNPLYPFPLHIRALQLETTPEMRRACRSLLSAAELARAERFVSSQLQGSYEVSHGALRLLLSSFLGRPARDLTFSFGPNGKPRLTDHPSLWFNMSHSTGLVLYGFTRACELGVDIECIKPVPELDSIAQCFFTSAEASQILALPSAADRQHAFYCCWTRKEAYVKALGEGLFIPFDQFEVTILPGEAPHLMRRVGDNIPDTQWTLHHLDCFPGYIGAVAYQHPLLEIDIRLINLQYLLNVYS